MMFQRVARLAAVLMLCVAFFVGGSAQASKMASSSHSMNVITVCGYPCPQ